MLFAGALACCAALARPAAADIVFPGYRAIEHTLVVDPSPLLGQWTLLAHPVRGFGGLERVQPGTPFDFSGKYGTRLYAVPPGTTIPPDDSDALVAWLPTLASAPIPVSEVKMVSVVSSVESMQSRVRIVAIGPDGLVVEPAGEETRRAPFASSVQLLAGAAGVFGVVLLLRRRRAKPA